MYYECIQTGKTLTSIVTGGKVTLYRMRVLG
jgi:hypothetical protein